MTSISNSAILKRIMPYCAKAERCTQDVVRKLASWDVPEEEMGEIVEILMREKFIDDVRYANSFVADKWRLDQWGQVKISNGLFQKGIGEVLIQNALDTIDLDQYISGMEILLSRKRDTIRKDTLVSQMKKILSFGVSRGFEEEYIWKWLEKEGLSFDRA
jgi:regulatory protein